MREMGSSGSRSSAQEHMGRPVRLAVVTNIPAPYRVPVYNRIAADGRIELKVFYASRREPDRQWDLGRFEHEHTFVDGVQLTFCGRHIHHNPGIFRELAAFRPDVVLTTGFNPIHLFAFAYAVSCGAAHVAMTDGTDISEKKLSWMHRWIRRIIFRRTQAFVAASHGGMRLFGSYGIDRRRIFQSPLCANEDVNWANPSPHAPGADFIFCGRFVALKNPLFAMEVAAATARRLGRRVVLLVVGNGPLEAQMAEAARRYGDWLEVRIVGFATQAELPGWYASARILLFPSSFEPWGVVANEACASGLPVIVTPVAGVAGELIVDGRNGYVRDLDVDAWADAAATLLSNSALYAQFSTAARNIVRAYSFDNAAKGKVDAVLAAVSMRACPAAGARRTVVVVQRRLTHYRVEFFTRLRDVLASRGFELKLLVGKALPSEEARRDGGHLDWAIEVDARYFLGGRVCLLDFAPHLRDAAAVVLPQENKFLNHLPWLLGRHRLPVILWGHGRSLVAVASQPSQRLKLWVSNHADWWLAYTELSAGIVRNAGFAAERITVLNNAVDTAGMRQQRLALSPSDIDALRLEFGLQPGPVGVFLGSLHRDKMLDFLVAAARRIHERRPDFQLIIAGDGPLRKELLRLTGDAPWIRWLGARTGLEKVRALAVADVMLNPGMVGLGILDAFSCEIPMVTTRCGIHSPEIAYLEHNVNGLMVEPDVDCYADAVIKLLADPVKQAALRKHCALAAGRYTLDGMVENFSTGIEQAVAAFASNRCSRSCAS